MPDLTPIDDPNVKIPAAVRASSALAEQLHQAVYTNGDAPSDGEQGKQEGNGPNAAPPTPNTYEAPRIAPRWSRPKYCA